MSLPVQPAWPGDELVAAFVGEGSVLERPSDVRELTVRDGRLELPAGGQPRVVLVAWSRLTGQQVKRAAAGAEGPVPGQEVARRPVGDGWRVRFEEGAELATTLPHRWEDDPARRSFSGRATYTTSLRVDPSEVAEGQRLWLDLCGCTLLATDPAAPQPSGHSFRAEVATPVGEVAEVWVDGVPAGVLWSPPYRVDRHGHGALRAALRDAGPRPRRGGSRLRSADRDRARRHHRLTRSRPL